MSLLLRQNWYIARRSRLLWIISAAMLLISAASRLEESDQMSVAPGLGIAYAFFAASYLGEAGAAGRLEEQIISGAPRPQVYMASWLTVTGCSVLILLFTMAGSLLTGFLVQNAGPLAVTAEVPETQREFGLWTVYTAGMILNAAGYAGLYVLAGLLIAGRGPHRGTWILIVCVCIFLVFILWGGSLSNELAEPETLVHVDRLPAMTANGFSHVTAAARVMPNPSYVPEPHRSQVLALLRFLPPTQCTWLQDFLYGQPASDGDIVQTYLSSVLLASGSCAAGTVLFCRRQLT